jgi:hypothetical protein
LAPKRFGPIWSVPMQGAIVSRPLFRNSWTAAVARSTSQVTRPITAPWPTRLSTHDFETSGFEFCVSHSSSTSFLPSTPPCALIFLISSFAALSGALSNGAIWPLKSATYAILIVPADSAPKAVATLIAATTTAETRTAAPASPHLVETFMLLLLS